MANSARVLQFCASLEPKLDTVLFRTPDDDQQPAGAVATAAKAASTIGTGVYAGSLLKRSLSPMVSDRLSGLRATVPGFTQGSKIGQAVKATGSVLKDKPLQAISSVGSTLVDDVKKVGGAIKRGLGFSMRGGKKGGRILKCSALPRRVIELAAKHSA